MRLLKTAKLEAITDLDTRYAPIYLDVARKRVVATNGRSLAVIPVEVDDHDVSGEISKAAIVAARKLARRADESVIQANGSFVLADGSSLPRAEHPRHAPDADSVTPKGAASFTICLDAHLLKSLSDALGAESGDGIRIEFHGDDGPMVVSPILDKLHRTDGRKPSGLLMPMNGK